MEESINKQLSRLLGEIKKGHAKALGGIQLLLESRLSKVISGFFLQEADREDILEDTYLRIVYWRYIRISGTKILPLGLFVF